METVNLKPFTNGPSAQGPFTANPQTKNPSPRRLHFRSWSRLDLDLIDLEILKLHSRSWVILELHLGPWAILEDGMPGAQWPGNSL